MLAGAHLACPFTSAGEANLPPHVARLIKLKEPEIDVGEAALVLAKDVRPSIDLPYYLAQLRDLADRAISLAMGSRDPEVQIRALNTVLFFQENYRYDPAPNALDNTAHHFLDTILDTKLGVCITLPMLYIAVAQRAGYPIYPVHAPDHFFARYRGLSFARGNVECTARGKFQSDEDYIRRFAVSKKGLESGAYMRTLKNREYLSDLLQLTAGSLGKDRTQQKFDYWLAALELNPQHALGHDQFARLCEQQAGLPANKADAAGWKSYAAQYAKKARELGYVSREEVMESRKMMKGRE